MQKEILITGSSGFIGKNLVKKIPNHILPLDKDGKRVDLRKRNEVLKLKKAKIVIHLAGKIPSENNISKNTFLENNVLATLNILEYCVKKKIEKLIFVSSYVYGNPEKNPINEKQKVFPHNTYTKSKSLSEELCKIYAKKHGISLIILRTFNIFGNLQKNGFLISNLIRSIKNNQHFTIVNKKNKRDFLFIDDFIDAILKMVDYECEFEIFNVGSGKCFTLEKFVNIFEEKSGKKIKKKMQKSKQNNIVKIQADITKIKKKTGWYPKYTLEEGIEKVLLQNGLIRKK